MLSLQLLGTFSASLDGRRVEGFSTNKERALFAYLAVEADRPHPRDQLATLLWPDLPPDKARNYFRVTLHRLRQTVQHPHAEVIHATREAVGINPEVDAQVDANLLAQKLEAVREHDDGAGPCPACQARLTQAVELYGGPFLAGLTTGGSQPFDAWVRHKREWHHLRVLDALATLAQFHRWRGDSELAQKYAHRQLKLEPWRERAHRQLMHTLACSGNYSAALAQFETCRQTLADELGVDPSPQTARLYETILTAEALSFTRPRSFAWARACAVRGIALLVHDDRAHAAPLFKDCFAAMVADPGLSHLASYLPYVAMLIAGRSEPALATKLLACGVAQPNFRAAPELKLDFSQLRVELKEKLREGPFAAAWERGRQLDPTDAAEEVLEALESTG